jgi:hypothetical protein
MDHPGFPKLPNLEKLTKGEEEEAMCILEAHHPALGGGQKV